MKPYTLDDAEADLRGALVAGDLDEINRLGKVIDSLQIVPPVVSLHAAALWYAEHGLHVFPLTPGTKIPLKGSGGCLDATTDRDRVNSWWTGNPKANIGLATGHLVDVVDIDGLVGHQSRMQHWDQVFAAIDDDAVAKVLTPRPGGMHIYVPATGRGNAANIVPSVDYRGVGGYVVAPPSVNEQGTYKFLGPMRLERASKAA